jgi:hypothetical protein
VAELTYLIRYGVMGHIGRFRSDPRCGGPFDRGQAVVIQSHRGIELGEVLLLLDETVALGSWGKLDPGTGEDAAPTEADMPHVLRAASSDDLARAENVSESRSRRFSRCRGILEEAGWLWELLDVEPLFDGHSTVLHYLGSLKPDEASVRARFRVACDFDIVLEPVGGDLVDDASEAIEEEHGCGDGCGSGGCGSGGCGVANSSHQVTATANSDTAQHRDQPAPHGGCASCGISQWKAGRRRDAPSTS